MIIEVAHAVTAISMSIPGTNANSTSTAPGGFIANFYQFALVIGGVLAFGAIVYGGVLYTVAAGNPSKQTEGKEWIESALLGLLLLAGAYLILQTINPQLLNLTLPTLPPVKITGTNLAPNGVINGVAASPCGQVINGASYIGGCSTGTCTQNASGIWACTATGGASQSTDPVCKGTNTGCTVYTLTKPVSASCSGRGNTYNSCTGSAPDPSSASCFTQHQC